MDTGVMLLTLKVDTSGIENCIDSMVKEMTGLISVIESLNTGVDEIGEVLNSSLNTPFQDILGVSGSIADVLSLFATLFGAMGVSLAGFNITMAVTVGWVIAVIAAIALLVFFLVKYWDEIVEWIKNASTAICEWASGIDTKVREFFEGQRNNITTFFTNIWTSITMFFVNVWTTITTFATSLPTRVAEWLAIILTKLSEFAANAIAWASTNMLTITDGIAEPFSGLGVKIKEYATEVLTKLSEWVTEAVTWAQENIPTFVDEIIAFFEDMPDDVLQAGKDLVAGLWEGINEKKEWIIGKIGEFTDEVLQSIKDFFGIASPSKKMMEIGSFLGQGFGIGIDKSFDNVMAKSKNWTSAIMGEFGGLNVGFDTGGINIRSKFLASEI